MRQIIKFQTPNMAGSKQQVIFIKWMHVDDGIFRDVSQWTQDSIPLKVPKYIDGLYKFCCTMYLHI